MSVAGAVENASVQIETMNPSVIAIITLVMTGLLFPFVLHFFKKNERLHELTQTRLAEHAATLGIHEYRLISLEEWRRLNVAQHHTAPPAGNLTVNNS